jgi:3-hydroxyisobutyrate dehydrogenase-like beta-hydroxyacid dehydrogenase
MFKGEDKSRSAFGDAKASDSASGARETGPGPSGGHQVPGDVGFVGLGRMGTAMAANLAAAGRQVIAYVRRAERIGELGALGLKPTTDIADLFDCSIVISMLPDDRAVREIVFGRGDFGVDGLAGGMMPGGIHLSMSTISMSAAAELAGEHARCGQSYVAAPVFGNPDAAKARELFVVAAGVAADLTRCRPIFDALGQQAFWVGSTPETANLVKLIGNVMTGATLEILGEAFALGAKARPRSAAASIRPDRIDVRQPRSQGLRRQDCRATLHVRCFVLPLALKDVRLALAEAEAAGVPMPSVSVLRDRLISGVARGYAELDWSALGLLAAEEAGLNRECSVATGGPADKSKKDSRSQK